MSRRSRVLIEPRSGGRS